MKLFAKAALAAFMLAGVTAAATAPAEARVSIGFSLGDGYYGPPGHHRYNRYYEPVYYNGSWYRGPIYYRGYGPSRVYWIDNGWRHNSWRGPRPRRIDWRDYRHDRRDYRHHRHDRRHRH